MEHEDIIARWLQRVEGIDDRLAQALWEAYFQKLVRLARGKLGSLPRRDVDEEDVALSALDSFFRGAEAGRFPQLNDRDDLWRLLVTITVRKTIARKRKFFAKKRGGGAVRGESAFWEAGSGDDPSGIDNVLGEDPSPEFAGDMLDMCGGLLEKLRDPQLKTIALYKMESYTNEEIAMLLRCSLRTVQRKLEQIRETWTEDADE